MLACLQLGREIHLISMKDSRNRDYCIMAFYIVKIVGNMGEMPLILRPLQATVTAFHHADYICTTKQYFNNLSGIILEIIVSLSLVFSFNLSAIHLIRKPTNHNGSRQKTMVTIAFGALK